MAAVENHAIWRADLDTAGGTVLKNQVLIGTEANMDAQVSPDKERLVWMSNRSGFYEIWIGDSMAQNPVQLTHLERYSGSPRWSPDGQWIAFDSQDVGNASGQIYLIDAQGNGLHVLTSGPNRHLVPSWSRDGMFVYSMSAPSSAQGKREPLQIWKQSLLGGKSVQLTSGPDSVMSAFESLDGRTLFFTRFRKPGIWSVPAAGGSETTVIADKPQYGFWGHWVVAEKGMYLLDADAEPRPSIEFYDFATRKTRSILTLEKQPAIWQPSLSASIDGKTIFYTQLERQSVIKMMEFTK
jgi:Tol biopolymer transport system component